MFVRRLARSALGFLAALALMTGAAVAGDPPIRIEVKSDFGAEAKWTEAFVAEAADVLVDMMANPDVAPPKVIRVQLTKDANAAGIGGWAGRDAIGFASSVWPEEKHRLWIVAHELVNHLTAHYAAAGGFPSDWWANGRSPFPEYASCLVLRATGHDEAANWRQSGSAAKPDHALYWKLHEKHGFTLFAQMLRTLRTDGVDLGAIGAAWPSPDRVRSAYTIAYLSLAADANLASLCRSHGVGREPPDWKQRHPEIPFVEYEVTPADVDAILAARQWLLGTDADPHHHGGLRDAFRRGGAISPVPSDSPIAFRVKSGFETQSAWVQPYLERAALLLVDRLGGADRAPPSAIDVRLDLQPDAGWIGGGPTRAADTGVSSLNYISNTWPKETFRVWILTRDLARVLFEHYGGAGVPADLWSPEAWGDVYAAAVLDDLAEGTIAGWLDEQHATSAPHRIARKLTRDHGSKLHGRFLELLRSDGIDLAKIGAAGAPADRARSAYAAAYLSLAAGENLARPLREAGLGRRPADWEQRYPGTKFVEYELTAEDLDRVMQRRKALFARAASEKARAKFRAGGAAPK